MKEKTQKQHTEIDGARKIFWSELDHHSETGQMRSIRWSKEKHNICFYIEINTTMKIRSIDTDWFE